MPSAGLGPPKTRRCHFFDSQGKGIYSYGEYGCPRSASTCNFIHPSDPEWDTALADNDTRTENWRSTGEGSPRRSSTSSTTYHGRERRRSPSIDRQRGDSGSSRRSPPQGSSTHYRGQGPLSYSRSPRRDDSPPRHHSSFSTTRDIRPLPRRLSPPPPERPSSYTRPHSDRQPDPAPKGVSKPTRMGPGDRLSKKERRVPVDSHKGTTVPTSSGATASTAHKPSFETTPLTPSGSTKVPPRPFSEVLSSPPSTNSPAPPPTTDNMTPEQRRAVWEKRVALIADATQEYMDLGKLGQDVESRRRQVQLPAFDNLPSEIKDAFQLGLTNAIATYEKKKVSLNNAISKVSEVDFWPTVPAQRVGDMEVKLKEAKTMLGGLADSVGQLYKRIESVYGQRPGRPGPTPSRSDEGTTTAASASDDADNTRAKKRRRLSIDGNDTTAAGAAATTSPDVREDVESIRDTIHEIEDRLQEVENDMAQHSHHIMEQLETKVDEKIEEIARSDDIATLVQARLGPRTTQTIQAFDESFAQADREITELAQEMAALIPQLDMLQRDNNLFKEEDAAEKELLAQLVKADQENAEAIARLQEEAKTLQTALTAHAKRALPPSLAQPLSESSLEAIKGSIVTQVQEQILPIVAQTRAEVERIAKARDAELYEKLSDKLDQSAKMSQLISTWIERNPDDARQALAAAAAGAPAGGSSSSSSAFA